MADAPSPAELAAEVRAHLLTGRAGALATLNLAEGIDGYPFGSVVPYALTARFEPLLLMAGIAQHSRNLAADPRASLLIQDPAPEGDPQASWRVTLVGDLVKLGTKPGEGIEVVEAPELDALHARYRERVPDADSYFAMHDFSYWRMDVRRARYIAGFGRIRWVEPGDLQDLPHAEGMAEAAPGILEHMNADHADALVDYCRGLAGVDCARAELVEVDCTGFLVRTGDPDGTRWFSFGREVPAGEARHAFVELLERARG